MMKFICPEDMFRGKNLPLFFREYRYQYELLVVLHGFDKVLQVYRWIYNLVSKMHWEQWIVIEKVCPKSEMRPLLYFCIEMIYQSDLFSQFKFDGDKIVLVAPDEEQLKKWADIPLVDIKNRRYVFIDWYERLINDPTCHPDINPEWILMDSATNCDETTDMAQAEESADADTD